MANAKLAAATTIEHIHPDILMEALRRLDGPSLASASRANSLLRSVSSHPDLWRRLCLSTWPSLRHPRLLPLLNSSPRRLFSDAFPFPSSSPSSPPDDDADLPDQLISAVDLYHLNTPISSCLIETDTSTPCFRSSPFLIDAPPVAAAAAADVSPKDLILSWIVIDPATGRAVNLSSRRAVATEKRHWGLGETVARFSTVSGGWAMGPAVTWRKGGGDVMEVGLSVEDADGGFVSGVEGLRAVKAAMEAGRRKGNAEEEEAAKESFFEYLKMRRDREGRERFLDMCCVSVGVAVFLSFLCLLAFR